MEVPECLGKVEERKGVHEVLEVGWEDGSVDLDLKFDSGA